MSHRMPPRSDVGTLGPRPTRASGVVARLRTGLPPLDAALAATLSADFVVVSLTIAVRPDLRYESQLPAALPLLALVAACGLDGLLTHGRRLHRAWRASGGYVFVAPYVMVLFARAAAPELAVPWWTVPAAAGASAVPFLVAGLKGSSGTRQRRSMDGGHRNGTALVALGLMLASYGVSDAQLQGAVVEVLVAAAFVLAALPLGGLASAAATWRPRHWICLTWGSLVVWSVGLLAATTRVFTDPWWQLAAVLAAGLPLALVARREAPVAGALGARPRG